MALADQISVLDFTTALSADCQKIIESRILSHPRPANVWVLERAWYFRLCFRGRLFTLGKWPIERLNAGINICRFADLARLFFAPWCARSCRRWNISAAQAKQDLQSETALVKLLEQQREYLLSLGVLIPRAAVSDNSKRISRISKAELAVTRLSGQMIALNQSLVKKIESINHDAVIVERLDALAQITGNMVSILEKVVARLNGVQSGVAPETHSVLGSSLHLKI